MGMQVGVRQPGQSGNLRQSTSGALEGCSLDSPGALVAGDAKNGVVIGRKYGNNYCSIAEAMEIGLVGASPDSPGGQKIKNMLEMAGDRAEAENALV